MFRKMFFLIAALLGIGFSIFMIYWGTRRPPEQPLYYQMPRSPYAHYIAGEGLIESLSENVDLSVPFPDLVWDVLVETGQSVRKDEILFALDTRQIKADLEASLAELQLAKTTLKNQTVQFCYYQSLRDKNAVSKQQYTQAYYAKKEAEDRVRVAEQESKRIMTQIERSIVRAPFDGEILQSNVKVGEFANINPFDRKSLIIFGSTQHLQMRISVAEEDSWRVIPHAQARAFVRGNPSIEIPLKFSYIEPYIVPKELLTGTDFERVDTRVLHVVYEFERGCNPVYVGQLLDVYMEAKPSGIS